MTFHSPKDILLLRLLRQMHSILRSAQSQTQWPSTMTREINSISSSYSQSQHLASLGGLPCCAKFSTTTNSMGCMENNPEKKKLRIPVHAPSGGSSDWIGPPDPTSNIRPIRFYIPPNETEVEKEFRLRREDTLQWNHKFWSEHNAKFFAEKELFTKSLIGDEKRKKLTPEEMSVFYRKFLNDNRSAHLEYNKEWYKRNISLLWPAFRVALINLRRRLSGSKREDK